MYLGKKKISLRKTKRFSLLHPDNFDEPNHNILMMRFFWFDSCEYPLSIGVIKIRDQKYGSVLLHVFLFSVSVLDLDNYHHHSPSLFSS